MYTSSTDSYVGSLQRHEQTFDYMSVPIFTASVYSETTVFNFVGCSDTQVGYFNQCGTNQYFKVAEKNWQVNGSTNVIYIDDCNNVTVTVNNEDIVGNDVPEHNDHLVIGYNQLSIKHDFTSSLTLDNVFVESVYGSGYKAIQMAGNDSWTHTTSSIFDNNVSDNTGAVWKAKAFIFKLD
jgi:hypothetical protein